MSIEAPSPQAAPAAGASRLSDLMVLVLLLVSVGFATAGQVTLKHAMTRIGRIGQSEFAAASDTLVRMAKEPALWIGLTLFGISALFWLVVLSQVPLSVAYPVVGLSYVIIVAFSRVVLHEHVPLLRWIGVVVVALGIALVGVSFRRMSGA
ncbi:MAG: EamA family transporter [Actinomycetota bacterium]